MERGQAAFLQLSDTAGTVFARWQSYWLDSIVNWSSQPWAYQQFDWNGITSGQAVGDQGSITLPAVPSVQGITEAALAGPWIATLTVLQFDEAAASGGPPATTTTVAACVGEIISASATLTAITWRLGSALAPVGAQFPPRTAITPLIGVPCRL